MHDLFIHILLYAFKDSYNLHQIVTSLQPEPIIYSSFLSFLLLFLKVEPLIPPPGSLPGTLITFAGHKSDPAEAGNRASKAYGKVADDFFVSEDGLATFKGIPFMTPLGAVKSNLKGKIS